MAFLVKDPTYPEREEESEAFRANLAKLFEAEFGNSTIEDVDAGPGASDPALLLQIVEFVALTIALLSAPETLSKNLPYWKSYFDRIVNFFGKQKLSYSIDAVAARNLALFYVLNKTSGDYNNIEIISLIRHTMNVTANAQDLTESYQSELQINTDPIENHYTAVASAYCRYIALIEIDGRAFTVAIEKDGRCSFIEQLS